MRLPDEQFARLHRLADFEAYYEGLSAAEMVAELDRLHVEGDKRRTLFRYLVMHRRLMDFACFDVNLSERQRSAMISSTTQLRDCIDIVILPKVEDDLAERVRAAMAASDDYADRYGYYPRAVEMIRVGARKPEGPYELGVVGEVLVKDTDYAPAQLGDADG